MPVTARYLLLCDEVRREDNGKLIVLGLYTPDVSVPQIPFVMPSLTFFACLDSDVAGNFQFTLRLEHLETGIQGGRPLAEGMGAMQFRNPGTAFVPVRFGNVQFVAAGPYVFSLNLTGQDPITFEFQVRLNTPRVQAQP